MDFLSPVNFWNPPLIKNFPPSLISYKWFMIPFVRDMHYMLILCFVSRSKQTSNKRWEGTISKRTEKAPFCKRWNEIIWMKKIWRAWGHCGGAGYWPYIGDMLCPYIIICAHPVPYLFPLTMSHKLPVPREKVSIAVSASSQAEKCWYGIVSGQQSIQGRRLIWVQLSPLEDLGSWLIDPCIT